MDQAMQLLVYQVDAFSDRPFGGNPAAVCLVQAGLTLSDEVRQTIAEEMNLSETAFVEPVDSNSLPGNNVFKSSNTFKLRWFTPTVEVPLCGHATLASAAVLFEEQGNGSATLHFQTLSGTLSVSRAATGADNPAASKQLLQMVLPRLSISSPVPNFVTEDSSFLKAVVGELQVAEIKNNSDIQYLLVALTSGTTRQQLEAISPDFSGMEAAAGAGTIRGVIVTAAGDGKPYDVLSRFFAPWCGIPEDPVTGSAHSLLAPYWSARLDKSSLIARQCSSRGGDLQLYDNPDDDAVLVAGYSAVVLKGQLML